MNDTLDNDLIEIEEQLANLSPNQMPDDMLARMEQAMISWEKHLPKEENIIPFNPTTPDPSTMVTKTAKPNTMHFWGAAAAIALMGCVVGVFTSGDTEQVSSIANATNDRSSITETATDRISANIAPELSRNITHASNEGITFAGKNSEPFKVLRIEYTEKVITTDKMGNKVITHEPCVEHVLVPVPVQ